MNTPTTSLHILPNSSQVAGVMEFDIKGLDRKAFNFTFLSGSNFASKLIAVRGIFYIASEIINNVQPGFYFTCSVKDTIRFGPGARRHYSHVTESLLDGFRKSAMSTINQQYRAPSAFQVERAHAIIVFADAIEEYITAPAVSAR